MASPVIVDRQCRVQTQTCRFCRNRRGVYTRPTMRHPPQDPCICDVLHDPGKPIIRAFVSAPRAATSDLHRVFGKFLREGRRDQEDARGFSRTLESTLQRGRLPRFGIESHQSAGPVTGGRMPPVRTLCDGPQLILDQQTVSDLQPQQPAFRLRNSDAVLLIPAPPECRNCPNGHMPALPSNRRWPGNRPVVQCRQRITEGV